jgi:hypothetical protein
MLANVCSDCQEAGIFEARACARTRAPLSRVIRMVDT